MEPLLDTLGVPFHRLDAAADLTCIDKAYAQAEQAGNAVVVLVAAPLADPQPGGLDERIRPPVRAAHRVAVLVFT